MKILLLHQYFLEEDDPGGSRFNEMAKAWADAGHQVTVLAGMVHYAGSGKRPEYKGRWFVRKQHGSVEVWRCHVSESYNKSFLGRLWAYFAFVFSSIYAGLFKVKGRYDVVLATSPPLFIGITAYVLGRARRLPVVFEVRDLWPESAIDTGVLTNPWIIRLSYWFEAFIYRKSRLVNVLTPAFREKLIEKGVPQEKILFIPNAADFSLSDEVLAGFNRPAFRQKMGWEGKMVVTYVGAHGVANHLIQVLDAAELLRDTPAAHLVLVGSGMQKPMLMAEAEKRGLRNVQFIEPVPKREVFRYIAASDFGASILKKVDTFKTIYSNKTFDYMSCRRPVLMAIDGVSRQLVEEAGCGLYVEPENPADFAAGVKQCLDMSEAERQRMGEAGYVYARTHFDRQKLAEQYLEQLKRAAHSI
ncbi:MAG: glycosyltransferase family 4 protein [Phaeodactylibacter sp.]|nr:glycosyltransferase family 4 protein [Calditrichota bacterium]MCB0581757.1 glycosyltransferase family 4 protein [Phaeodactylibacter sp.]MCB9294291.1 glycosyltransferase family 4 protein [Lewinellaceae bacterium]